MLTKERFSSDYFDEYHPTKDLEIGEMVTHPSGRLVEIQDFDEQDNTFSWRELLRNGNLGPIERGKGW